MGYLLQHNIKENLDILNDYYELKDGEIIEIDYRISNIDILLEKNREMKNSIAYFVFNDISDLKFAKLNYKIIFDPFRTFKPFYSINYKIRYSLNYIFDKDFYFEGDEIKFETFVEIYKIRLLDIFFDKFELVKKYYNHNLTSIPQREKMYKVIEKCVEKFI